jgi:hypothetical protein
MNNLANSLMLQERHEEAEEILREILPKRERQFGVEADLTQATRLNLAEVLNAEQRPEEAAERLEPLWQRVRSTKSHPYFREIRATYASTLLALVRYDEAEALLLAAHREALGPAGAASADSRYFAGLLASLYEAWQKSDEAAKCPKILHQEGDQGKPP